MPDTTIERHGVRLLLCGQDGPKLANDRDAAEVAGAAVFDRIGFVAIPVERLADGFFTLSTRMAGEILGKLTNYRLRVAIIGDISEHLARSSALRDFVVEANRGPQLWFVADLNELDRRIAGMAAAQ